MLRDIKRVRNRVAVLPTMAAQPTAPKAPGHSKPAGLARQDAPPGVGRNATARLSDTLGPTEATATDTTAPLSTRDKPAMPAGAKPATMAAARPTAPPGTSREAPTDIRRARRWLKIVAIAACLVAVAAGGWLYRSEVANYVEMTIPPATRTVDDSAQVKQAPQRERAEALAHELTMEQRELKMRMVLPRKASDEASQAQQAAERIAAELRQALQQERDKTEKLTRELATTRRELGSQAALTKAGDKAPQNQQPTELRQALQQAEWLSAAYQEMLAQERARSQGLELQLAARRDDQQLLTQERARSQGLELQLAARRDDQGSLAQERARNQAFEQQLAARQDNQGSLAQERARNQGLEQQLAARLDDQQLLTQERARNQALEQQLAARQDATPGRGRNATASLSDTPGPTPATALAADKPATAPLPTMATRLAASEAPGNPEAPRLMARASLLLSQGNVGAARIVLDRAAKTGSAPALFALAETYDQTILAAWGTFGTQGDAAKARELYAKAFAGGVQEARDRLDALRE